MSETWPFEFPGAYWLDDREESAVLDVLRNGSLFRYYGLGTPRYVDALEAAAREFYGVDYALALNSGTGALTVALTALGIGPGCEVIVPSYLWVATVGAVVQANAIPVLCEVDESFTMDSSDLERKITARTKLILPIHMAGAPCDMAAIMGVAAKHLLPVLEDCAQCNGGSFGGQKVGTFGAMGIFSLQLNKNMTCGEGGLLITNDAKLYNRAFSAHDMGVVRKDGRLAEPEPHAVLWGQGRRMTELAGAVASVQITKLPDILAHMRGSKARIKGLLGEVPGLAFRHLHDPAGDTAPFMIVMLPDAARAQAVAARLKEAGMHNTSVVAEAGQHIYYNIPPLVGKVGVSPSGNPWTLEANRESQYDYQRGACPHSDALFARSIIVPVPSRLTAAQEEWAAVTIRKAVTA
jgi:8-amino-3,8-dideoxy-alpha-D-manno-octulosonate transaminase